MHTPPPPFAFARPLTPADIERQRHRTLCILRARIDAARPSLTSEAAQDCEPGCAVGSEVFRSTSERIGRLERVIEATRDRYDRLIDAAQLTMSILTVARCNGGTTVE